MILPNALDGFYFHMKAEGYSDSTIDLYRYMLTVLDRFLESPRVEAITASDLTRYFAYLRSDYKPRRNGSNHGPLTGSTLQNHWKAIRTFFRWAVDELDLKGRPDEKLKLPKNNPEAIQPLSEDEVKRLIESAERTKPTDAGKRKSFTMKRPTAERDTALIILLLDTGIRAGEASRLDIEDVHLAESEIYIKPFGNSRRKTKSRILPIGKATTRALWRYLETREDVRSDDPLFMTKTEKRMDRNVIRLLFKDLGDKAGVNGCHPHRLRHTFAVEYLRNGGDIFTLQMNLGHSSLEMVRTYLQLAQADTKSAHRRASPADKWRL